MWCGINPVDYYQGWHGIKRRRAPFPKHRHSPKPVSFRLQIHVAPTPRAVNGGVGFLLRCGATAATVLSAP
jgi:hypothetical protein